jgi:hypothetical protein
VHFIRVRGTDAVAASTVGLGTPPFGAASGPGFVARCRRGMQNERQGRRPLEEQFMRQRYRRRPDQAVTAVQLALDFDGFGYRKWGDLQRAQAGDWLVDNGGDVYTVAAETFERTYRELSPGRWVKTAPVWAERATQPGSVGTQEGVTHYAAGDWLVCNHEDGRDAYAVGAAKFEQLYEPDPNGASVDAHRPGTP